MKMYSYEVVGLDAIAQHMHTHMHALNFCLISLYWYIVFLDISYSYCQWHYDCLEVILCHVVVYMWNMPNFLLTTLICSVYAAVGTQVYWPISRRTQNKAKVIPVNWLMIVWCMINDCSDADLKQLYALRECYARCLLFGECRWCCRLVWFSTTSGGSKPTFRPNSRSWLITFPTAVSVNWVLRENSSLTRCCETFTRCHVMEMYILLWLLLWQLRTVKS